MPLDQTIDTLNQLKDALSQESCVPKEPFIKLGTGQAPTLNYNIPQTACFSTYGNMPVRGISEEAFQTYTRIAPRDNFFDVVERTEPAVLEQRFSEAVQLQPEASNFIPNVGILRRQLDVRTNFDAVALAQRPAVAAGFAEGAAEAVPIAARVIERRSAINEVQLTRLAKEGNMPYVVEKFGGFQTRINFLTRPPAVKPYFVVIEEYKTCAYLGDYGAGRTVKTFSLLPGEKTTISIRTYKDVITTQSRSENVLDSFSENSTDEMEKFLEQENGFSVTDSSTSSSTNSSNKTKNFNAGLDVSLFGIIKLGASGGTQGTTSSSDTKSNTGTRTSNVKGLNRALDKHIAASNSSRQIDVNTTTSSTASEGEEQSTIRELVNYNKSRVLNFVFRQLLQEYVTITYLSNIRIAYCNGYAESLRVVDLEDLESLLNDTVVPGQIETVRNTILKPYCFVFNHQDESIPFIEQISVNYGECLGLNETETFWRIRKDIEDTYSSGGLDLTVKGVILSVTKQTLRTSSLVTDALLGQGEALDCFNQKAQDAEALNGYLGNIQLLQQIEAIENIEDPAQKAEMYKKIFGTCCDVPQTQIIP